MTSGIGVMSKEFVFGTIHYYNWIQLGGAIKHPESGNIVNMDEISVGVTGVPEAKLTVMPIDGYGNPELIRFLIDKFKVSAILHYTDPRFWGFLYQMEAELRQNLPLMYYSIWDAPPAPSWNAQFYESCDAIFNISKQTHGLVKQVLKTTNVEVIDITGGKYKDPENENKLMVSYIPHGINEQDYYPIDELDKEWAELQNTKKLILGEKEYDFIMFYNSRNIRRKMTSDMLYAYRTFCDTLTKEQADKCVFILHTQPIDENGTNLPEVVKNLIPDYDVVFSTEKLEPRNLNHLYNIADVTVNIASNEGFGLGTAESLMAGTPIIVNVTGGMQDQCGFKNKNGEYLTKDDYTNDWGSNHDGRYKKCGNWVKPVFPASRSIQGSPITPYISDDRCDWQDVAICMLEWYETPTEIRKEYGLEGHNFVNDPEIGMGSSEMCRRFIQDINMVMKHWNPKKRFVVLDTNIEDKKFWNGLTLNKEIKVGALD